MFKVIGETFSEFGLPGVAIGLGTIIAIPLILPPLVKVGKPVVKAVIKTGIIAYEKGKDIWGNTSEILDDLIAESKAELAEEASQKVLTVEAHAEAS